MRLLELRLTQFRNHAQTALHFGDGINALVGNNGQGKTNILEAVSYLSLGKSFFGAADQQALMNGGRFFDIRGVFVDDAGRTSDVHVVFDSMAGEKGITVNGTRLEKISGVVGEYPAVILSPEHGGIIAAGPAERRKFLDIVLCQTSPSYLEDLQEYRRVLRQRNRLLLDARLSGRISTDALEPWTQSLVVIGSRILHRRMSFIEEIRPTLIAAYAEIAGAPEELTVQYVTVPGIVPGIAVGEIAGVLGTTLAARRTEELRRGASASGPHRDDMAFSVRGMNAQTFASQGEQKTLLVALKLAEHRYVCDVRNERPVLLLDDVFAELDPSRAERVLSRLRDESQVVITATDEGVFAQSVPWNSHHRRFVIERGTCTAQHA